MISHLILHPPPPPQKKVKGGFTICRNIEQKVNPPPLQAYSENQGYLLSTAHLADTAKIRTREENLAKRGYKEVEYQ